VIFSRQVAWEAFFVHRLIARLAVGKVGKTPAARFGVLLESFIMN
jgi:hypothetical protein